MSVRRIVSLWAPVAAYVALLYALSAQQQLPAVEHVWDKALHSLGYLALGILTIRAFHGGLGPLVPKPTWLALAFTVGYGATDELHQSFVPGRHASVLDVAADAVGFALAAALVYLRYNAFRGEPAS